MKNLRLFSFLMVMMAVVAISGCFLPGDDILPRTRVRATHSELVGSWECYAIGEGPRSPVRPFKGVTLDVYRDGSLVIHRWGQEFPGTWTLNAEGSRVDFHLNIADEKGIPFPPTLSIANLTATELWLETAARHHRLRRI